MSKFSPEDVARYYDKMTRSYLDIYGEVIQAFRPKGTDELLNYIAKSAGLKYGMRIADLGCGVGGPARYFSKYFGVKVDGVTISNVQSKAGAIKSASQVRIICGDYHQLPALFTDNSYDVVLFLESLGHSHLPKLAIQEAFRILKPGGILYVKDFFKKVSIRSDIQNKIDEVITQINQHYTYQTLGLENLLGDIRLLGFEVIFIRKPDFRDDITIRSAFENEHGIDIFQGKEEFYPAEWLELKFVKS